MNGSRARQALDAVRLQVAAGAVPGTADNLPDRARRALALAAESGAPLLDALDAADDAMADEADRHRAVTIASAQSRAVAGVLLAMPAVLLPLLAGLLELDPVGFYTTTTGAGVGAVAAGLLLIGAAWIRRLVSGVDEDTRSRARPLAVAACAGLAGLLAVGPTTGALAAVGAGWWRWRTRPGDRPPAGLDEVADLVATATAGGMGPAAALRLAAAQRPDLAGVLRRLAVHIDLDRPQPGLPPGMDRLGALLVDARRLGAPAVPALRDLARRLRARDRTRVLAATERLPAQLTFPTALCLLPGSMLLIGAPLVMSGLETAGL